MSFEPGFDSRIEVSAGDWIIGVVGSRILLDRSQDTLLLPYRDVLSLLSWTPTEKLYLGTWQNIACFAFIYPADLELPSESPLAVGSLRSRLGVISDELFHLGGRALQLAHWYEFHRFCGRCGHPTELQLHERVLACPSCAALFYPRIAPCVIGIVIRGQNCLLAHNVNFAEGLYSTLAGFIEPGETAEQALAREIREETGIEVEELEYIASQPWPFPSQLMLGFVARYKSGDIKVDGVEITDAQWFAPDTMPTVPPPHTISGKLIDIFLQRANLQG
jgi:NTP pyrophosphohydrolases containing a Zn-finger, probably nucleic-acid-binding